MKMEEEEVKEDKGEEDEEEDREDEETKDKRRTMITLLRFPNPSLEIASTFH